MNEDDSGSNGDGVSPQVPAVQALEAVTQGQSAKMHDGLGKEPSDEALSILARMIARKAHRELQEKQLKSDDTQRNS